ncbi:MAG: DUF3010 family protein [Flavobacterium sp.]|nr:DUF3010 family protein [Flavobacterium sp.]
MKVLGVEISGREVRVVALEKSSEGIIDYTGKYKPIILEGDEISGNVILFKNTLFAAFDSFAPNVIVVKYRNPNGKGPQAPSPISFKIEGLIQMYPNVDIKFTKPQNNYCIFQKECYGYQAKLFISNRSFENCLSLFKN